MNNIIIIKIIFVKYIDYLLQQIIYNFTLNNITISNSDILHEIFYWLINLTCRNIRHYRFSN